MQYLLQPPPLLAMFLVVALLALVFWPVMRGWRTRVPNDAALPGQGTRLIGDEEGERWGDPEPAPIQRVPFDYDRLTTMPHVEPEVSLPEPAAQAPLQRTTDDEEMGPQRITAPSSDATPRPVAAAAKATVLEPLAPEPQAAVEAHETAEPSLAEILSRGQRRRGQGSE